MADIKTVDGLPKDRTRKIISQIEYDNAKYNNSFVISGASPSYPDPLTGGTADNDIIVFLEQVISTGTFEIKGSNGTTVGAVGIPSASLDAHAPIRLDGGVSLVGTVILAKGFWIKK